MIEQAKFFKCLLLIGAVCSVLQLASASEGGLIPSMSFLESKRSDRLASLTEKLDFDQTRELLLDMLDSPGEEMLTTERAIEMIKMSDSDKRKCSDNDFFRFRYLIHHYDAFPNIKNYLQECEKRQRMLCD